MFADEIMGELSKTSSFFHVSFRRRTPKKDKNGKTVEVEGTIREMVCRTGVNSFKKGIVSDEKRNAEDLKHAVLTVFDIQHFLKLLKAAKDVNTVINDKLRFVYGCKSWRRINVLEILSLSVLTDAELPPNMKPELHEIKNAWQLQRLENRS
jgi:hypothetical protein